MITHFQEVTYTRKSKNKEGKIRQKTFSMTLNPFNKNEDGSVRNRQDIMKCLIQEANEWEVEIKK